MSNGLKIRSYPEIFNVKPIWDDKSVIKFCKGIDTKCEMANCFYKRNIQQCHFDPNSPVFAVRDSK